MKVESFKNIPLEVVEMEGAKGVTVRWLISRKDGAPNFAMRLFTVEPGGCTPLHTHPFEHEAFVLEGEGVLVFEEKEYEFKKDYFLFVPPDKEHQFQNTGEKVLKFLCLVPL